MMAVDLLKNDAFLTQEVLRLALESAGIGVWRVDPLTRSVELTAAMKQIFGLPLDQQVDYGAFFQLLHPDDRDRALAGLAGAFDPAGDGHTEVEFRILTAAAETKWLQARGQAYFEGEGVSRKPTLFVGTLRDVTESKAAEAAQGALVEHQQTLIHEVNHRVKNSLQLVTSLLRLQARQIGDAASRGPLEVAINRISTIAHIHQRLYRDQDVKNINFGAFLSELCADLQSTSPSCSLSVSAPQFLIATDRAIPLALAVNELITNAFKYAYPGGKGPVSVAVEQPRSGEIVIRVEDQGVGLPDEFSIEGTRSLGMILITNLIGQLAGKVEVQRNTPIGSRFVITVPGEIPA